MDEQKPTNALYVGTILVEIAVDGPLGDYVARTFNDHVLGPTELGFDVSFTAHEDLEDDDDARTVEEIVQEIKDAEVVTEVIDEAVVRELIDGIRFALARCCIFGKIELVNDGFVGDRDWKVVEKVRDELPAEYFEITPALFVEACSRQEEKDAALGAFLEQVGELLKSQQQHEDEDVTVGEALDRQKKGSEEIRRIIEGN